MQEILVHHLPQILFTAISVTVLGLGINLYNRIWVKPRKLRSRLNAQGIRGPPPSLLLGNLAEMKSKSDPINPPSVKDGQISHHWPHSLFPFFKKWSQSYGGTFSCWLGNVAILYVEDHELVKEISMCTSMELGKPTYLAKERGALLGQGILTSNGQQWAYQRKIMAPELYMEKVKGKCEVMAESVNSLVKLWEMKIGENKKGDIRIDEDLRSFSADVISKACFGSSYSNGQQIFSRLRALQQAMSSKTLLLGLPGLKHIPTKNNRDIWRLEKEIRCLILEVVEERRQRQGRSEKDKDLLDIIMEGAKNSEFCEEEKANFIVDNCKNVYFAGHETTAMSACWTLLLLASNPLWQARVRAEVLDVCADAASFPNADMIRKMKLLGMVIQEALRLYPTVVFMSREAMEDMKLGNLIIPKGVNIWIPVVTLHRDKSIWGEDADEFKPERFANGAAAACRVPQLYLPFGAGPRICAGQNLALMELKMLLSLLLSNFSFSISPKYRHSPVFKLVVEPEFGLNLIVERI